LLIFEKYSKLSDLREGEHPPSSDARYHPHS
jgi:hypothetical protein